VRVVLLQRTLEPPGGGNAVAAWMLHALAPQHDVTTITERSWDAALVNRFYGTAIDKARVRQRHAAWPWSALARAPGRLDRLRLAVLQRVARRLDADLFITADNYAAFPRPGVQYLHFPLPLHPAPAGPAPLVRAYYRACDALSGLNWEAAARNTTLVNSEWTAKGTATLGRLSTQVLYPPVPDPGAGLPWEDRENTFLCVGRFHGSKRLDLVIDIVRRARRTLSDARLVVVGSTVDAEYTARLRNWVAPISEWASIEVDLPQSELHARMRRARYGIHAMVDEHFGIAPAEMARAGCLVFVHDSGGLVEVVGGQQELRWATQDEAVARIEAIAAAPERARMLSTQLAAHAERFSSERFVREFTATVNVLLQRGAAGGARVTPP
jgi:glycosyltransferase involved in cell wall biosynthesis